MSACEAGQGGAGLEPAEIKGPYHQSAIRGRLRAFFLDDVGRVATRAQLLRVASDPVTGQEPENWHQRLSELRTDEGYDILTYRDLAELKPGEYVLASAERCPTASRRLQCAPRTWQAVLERANHKCEWNDGGVRCGLRDGDTDPVGGETVRLTPDHRTPHQVDPRADPLDLDRWQALCGRHQVMKKNYWDHTTGWLNVYAIVQSASREDKKRVYEFLKRYFGE